MARNKLGGSLSHLDDLERRSLTPLAVTAIKKLVLRWQLPEAEMMKLTGFRPDRVAEYRLLLGNPRELVLTASSLRRISFLLGICEELDRLYPPYIADEWISQPHQGHPFRGRAPLAYLRMGLDAQGHIRAWLRRQRERAHCAALAEE